MADICFSDKKKSTENLKSEAEIWSFRACAVKNTQYDLNYGGISEIPASYRKSGSGNTMVTSDFRPEVSGKMAVSRMRSKIRNIYIFIHQYTW